MAPILGHHLSRLIYLFRFPRSSLNDDNLVLLKGYKDYLSKFFTDKLQKIYTDDITVLWEKGQTIIDQIGAYLVW